MADHIPEDDFLDPNFPHGVGPFGDGPFPPRRPSKSNGKCKRQIIWPRDKMQKGAYSWRRWKDIFTNKGPDMWVGKQGDDGPHRQAWSHWGYGGNSHLFENLGYRDKRDGEGDGPPPWNSLFGNRSLDQKYDFKTRKYKKPSYKDWSDVKWDRNGKEWLYIRNRYGNHRVKQHVIDRLSGLERARCYQRDLPPFQYDQRTPYWDWFVNERPLYWEPPTEEAWAFLEDAFL